MTQWSLRRAVGSFALVSALALTACDALPRDPDGTSDRVAQSGRFTVALADPSLRADPLVTSLIRDVERRSKARAQWQGGSGETLFKHLDDDRLDLVIGRFRADTPWATMAAFGPPLASHGESKDRLELKAAMRNGENRWIMTVERASRAVSAEARTQ